MDTEQFSKKASDQLVEPSTASWLLPTLTLSGLAAALGAGGAYYYTDKNQDPTLSPEKKRNKKIRNALLGAALGGLGTAAVDAATSHQVSSALFGDGRGSAPYDPTEEDADLEGSGSSDAYKGLMLGSATAGGLTGVVGYDALNKRLGGKPLPEGGKGLLSRATRVFDPADASAFPEGESILNKMLGRNEAIAAAADDDPAKLRKALEISLGEKLTPSETHFLFNTPEGSQFMEKYLKLQPNADYATIKQLERSLYKSDLLQPSMFKPSAGAGALDKLKGINWRGNPVTQNIMHNKGRYASGSALATLAAWIAHQAAETAGMQTGNVDDPVDN